MFTSSKLLAKAIATLHSSI